MAEWIYFLHAPREDFAATMTDDGSLTLAEPTLGRINTGLCIFTAPDEASARTIMETDPAIASGIAAGELREMRVSLLRGRPLRTMIIAVGAVSIPPSRRNVGGRGRSATLMP